MFEGDCNSIRILFAEDHPAIQDRVGSLIREWGFDADIVSNGLEAVRYAEKNTHYDLCLMDKRMPVLDGIKAAGKIRWLTDYFPIIIYSADKPVCYEYLRNKGIDDWIEKSCDPDHLYERIMKWCNLRETIINTDDNNFTIHKETPMNSQDAQQIKKLKEKGLSLMSVFGTSTEATFVVNEGVPEFIEQEFTENQKPSVKFLDHNPEAKGGCCLFAKTSLVVKTHMVDEYFEEENQNEKNKLKKMIVTPRE